MTMSKGRNTLLFAALLFASVQIPAAANAEPWLPFFSFLKPAQPVVETVAPAPAPVVAAPRRQRVAVVAPEVRQARPPIIIGIGF
jgi:hypothetical protein